MRRCGRARAAAPRDGSRGPRAPPRRRRSRRRRRSTRRRRRRRTGPRRGGRARLWRRGGTRCAGRGGGGVGELDGLREQVVASLGVLLCVVVLTHRRLVKRQLAPRSQRPAPVRALRVLRPRRRHRRPAARRARRRRLLAPRGHRAAHLAEAKALREQPHVRGARARVGHDAPRREARPAHRAAARSPTRTQPRRTC